MAGRWYNHARAVLQRAHDAGVERGLEGAALVAHIDAAYPFGPRAYHPYQMWLRARRDLFGGKLPGIRPPKLTATGRAAEAERARLAAWNGGQPIVGESHER